MAYITGNRYTVSAYSDDENDNTYAQYTDDEFLGDTVATRNEDSMPETCGIVRAYVCV